MAARMVGRAAALLAGLALAGGARSAAGQVASAVRVAQGLAEPVWVGAPAGESERLFIAEQAGRLRLLEQGVLNPVAFLDIRSKVYKDPFLDSQTGLLDAAFHPDYAANGFFYVYYSLSPASSVLSRFQVSASDPDQADPASETRMFGPFSNALEYHHGGGLAFGLDGMLYLAIGDQRDVLGGTCQAQQLDNPLGKLLRLADDGSVPADNPFVGVPGALPEIWATGLRSPFRLAFDALTGDLYLADVGESTYEEVDFLPATAPPGANFGWRVLEGPACTGSAQCAGLPCPDPGFVAPVYAFAHQSGQCAIIGGTVYRGSDLPGLWGAYVFGDWCTGRVWSFRVQGGTTTDFRLLSADLQPAVGVIDHVNSFGLDGDGELYLVDAGGASGEGEVYRLVPPAGLFLDLGQATPGSQGPPQLTGSGKLLPATPTQVRLRQGLPGGAAHLVVGFSPLLMPFEGGLLVPAPDVVLLGLPLDNKGELQLSFDWPAGLPVGLSTYWQAWIPDAAALQGWAASNALQATPP